MIHVDVSLANKYLVCGVCKGYYVDPVTMTECTHPHTFCRSCLKKSLLAQNLCPICGEHIAPQVKVKYTDGHCQSDRYMKSIIETVFPYIADVSENGCRDMTALFDSDKAQYLRFVRKAVLITVEPQYPTDFLTPNSNINNNNSSDNSNSNSSSSSHMHNEEEVSDCIASILYDTPVLPASTIKSKCHLTIDRLLCFLQSRLIALQLRSLESLTGLVTAGANASADAEMMPRLLTVRDELQIQLQQLNNITGNTGVGVADNAGARAEATATGAMGGSLGLRLEDCVHIELLQLSDPSYHPHDGQQQQHRQSQDWSLHTDTLHDMDIEDEAMYTLANPEDTIADSFCKLRANRDSIIPPIQQFSRGAVSTADDVLHMKLKYRYKQSHLNNRDVEL